MLKRLSDAAGMSVSAYVLSRALPSARRRFEELVEALKAPEERPAAVAALRSFLADLPDEAFRDATAAPVAGLGGVAANYAAATVESESVRRRGPPPAWTREIEALRDPHFAWDLPSLRPHLMRVTPPAFKRRRLFFAQPDDPRS